VTSSIHQTDLEWDTNHGQPELSLSLLNRAGTVRLRTSMETGSTVGTRHPDVPLANTVTEVESPMREHGSPTLTGAIAESGGAVHF
jgi:hypothetical protein